MDNYRWDTAFTELFERCIERYRSGDEDYTGYYTEADLEFLGSIGYKPREFFDFIEDFGDEGVPSLTTAVMIASVRRDYFRVVMNETKSEHTVMPDDLPAKSESLEGYQWLPRIIAKARGKLRGELDPNIMYSCGGDRKFLLTHNIAPADFLRAVWAAGDNDQDIVAFVAKHSPQ